MAKNNTEPSAFSALAEKLEQALENVKSRKAALDSANAEAANRQLEYSNAVRDAQSIHKDYQAHISEVMTGFAQVHA